MKFYETCLEKNIIKGCQRLAW